MTKIHATGSAFSYGRSYLIRLVFNIPTGEADDNGTDAGAQAECISEKQLSTIVDFINEYGIDEPKFLEFLGVAIKKRNCVIDLSSKFGAQEKDVFPLLYAACSAGLNVRGVAFHVGSQCKTPDSYLPALRAVRRIFDRASSESFTFDTLDIGGGLPISYRSPLPGVSEFCDVLSQGLEKLFPENLRIIAEPGRSISGDAMTLVVRVIGRSLRKNIPWYYIDDGVYGAFSGRLFDKCDYRLIPERSGPLTPCVVAGPSCDATDIVSTDQMLPRLEIGDLLLVPGMGAYTSVSATSFNGFPPPQILVTSDQWDSEQ